MCAMLHRSRRISTGSLSPRTWTVVGGERRSRQQASAIMAGRADAISRPRANLIQLALHEPRLAQPVPENPIDAAGEGDVPLLAAPGHVPPISRRAPGAGQVLHRSAHAARGP